MQGKKNIIDDILGAAKKSAAGMVSDAEQERDKSVEKLRADLEKAEALAKEDAKAAADALYAGKVKLGELEAGKIMLKAKREIVDSVYDGVRSRILGMKDADYLALLKKLIAGYAEDGDTVVAAQSDAKRVTAAWLKKVSAECGKKLALDKTYGDFSGGVVLRNKKYDRDLTIDEIVAELKDRTESETVRILEL